MDLIKNLDPLSESGLYIVGWLYTSQLSHDRNSRNECIYFLDQDGDYVPSPSPLSGLVLEYGEVNLHQYMKDKNSKISTVDKIHILEHIVSAVSFLHKLMIVHFDLKPENIVLFHTATHGTRWKLIDFDSSYNVNTNPKPSISYPINQNNNNIRATEEFAPPEVMKVINNNLNSDQNNNTIQINVKMDIWSIGMIGVILFFGQSLWKLLDLHFSSFDGESKSNRIMASNVKQDHINAVLPPTSGDKIKDFLNLCLQVESSNRQDASKLLEKKIFSTDNSTIYLETLLLTRDSISQRNEEIRKIIEQHLVEGNEFITDELRNAFIDFKSFLRPN